MGWNPELFVEAPGADLICSLCSTVFDGPISACTTPHVFCGTCIGNWWKAEEPGKCPECKKDTNLRRESPRPALSSEYSTARSHHVASAAVCQHDRVS